MVVLKMLVPTFSKLVNLTTICSTNIYLRFDHDDDAVKWEVGEEGMDGWIEGALSAFLVNKKKNTKRIT